MKYRTSLWIILIFSLLLAGCGTGAAAPTLTVAPTTAPDQQEAYKTSVAATMAVLNTQIADLRQAQQITPTADNTATTPAATLPAVTAAPVVAQSSGCEQATFVADITIPDGTNVPPGSVFTKTWAVKNSGSCAWTPDYQLVFAGGDLLGASQSIPLSDKTVAPGETVQVSVQFTAPQTLQVHRSFWKFLSSSGREFGVTDAQGGEQPVWMEIRVSNAYDFIANMCSASWRTGSGTSLPCPGDPNADTGGAVYRMNNSQWEGGVVEDEPVIVMAPPAGENTTLIGQFPPVIVPDWSWLKTRVGCLAGQESTCNVNVKITYSVDGGPEQMLYQGTQTADGEIGLVNVKMIEYQLFGKSTAFIWYVTVNGASDGDKIFWFTPVLTP